MHIRKPSAPGTETARGKSHTRDTAMVSRLRRGFVVTAMVSLLIIVILMIAVINIANFAQIDSSAYEMLEILAENGGTFPSETPAEPNSDDETEPPASEPIGSHTSAPTPEKPSASEKDSADADADNSNENSADEAASGSGQAELSDTTDAAEEDEEDTGVSDKPGGEKPSGDKEPPDGAAGEPGGRGGGGDHKPRSFPEMDISETSRIEAPFETRYFAVLLSADGTIENVNTDNIAAVEDDIAVEYALTVQYNGHLKGHASSYRYLAVEQEDGGLLVIFVDCSSSIAEAQQLLLSSLLVGLAALVLMFVLVLLFSGRAVSPVIESLEKQRRFISDAGHELKTPITVISANVDVLEMTGIKNEWTQSIRSQTRRMTDLVGNLLTLSRMEEDATPVVFSDVDLSALLRENAASFEAVAQAAELDYNVAIQDDVHISGDQSALRQLCTVLLDNSMKYCSHHGSIYVSLKADRREGGIRGKRTPRIVLEVSNTCDAIPEGNLDRLFDRFYRADSSRSRMENKRKPRASAAGFRSNGISEEEFYTGQIPKISEEHSRIREITHRREKPENTADSNGTSRSAGGFGIGLSVAKAVAQNHGGTIKAEADGDHLIRFIVTLPLKKTADPR